MNFFFLDIISDFLYLDFFGFDNLGICWIVFESILVFVFVSQLL
jgi:hypothetical protein